MRDYFLKISVALLPLIVSCNMQTESNELKYFPVDNLNDIITQSLVQIDKSVSSDGNGSIKIVAAGPVVVQLYNIDDIQVEDTQLIYEAKIKSDGLNGQAYLEMWCVFKDKGEFFSRGFDTAIAGTTDWKTVSVPFFLKKNEMPDQIKLNVVVNGVGTVWIDDIRLSKL